MRYVMLIYHGESLGTIESLPEEERNAFYAGWQRLNRTPGVTAGVGMSPAENATTVRVENRQTLTTDGPFAEVKEAIGGYFIYEGDDLDAAIAVAALVPSTHHGGAVEIRPVMNW